MRRIKDHWPLLAACAVLCAVLAACLVLSLEQNQGHLVYVLDDPYIHMAAARNLVEHGVAGVTRYGYSSASSSIGWPLLLAGTYWALGTSAAAPLAWNVVFGAAVLGVVFLLLRRHSVPPRWNFVYLLAVTFCTPLPAIVFTGMEHTLHVLLAVTFVFLAAKSISCQPEERSARLGRVVYLALPALLTLTRFEAAFMILVVCLLLAVRRRIAEAIWLGVSAAVPVVAHGLVALAHGWFFLPNPVLLKGRMPAGSSVDRLFEGLSATLATMIGQRHVPALIAAMLLALVVLRQRERRLWTLQKAMLWILLPTALLHVQFAKVGWFYRYEAYLMASGLVAVLMAAHPYLADLGKTAAPRNPAVVAAVVAAIGLPIAYHGVRSLTRIPAGTTLIYQQQYQMAAFVDRYYTGQGVAANDIGAINYYADIRNLDLWGLASMEVADARLRNRFGPEAIREIAARHRVKMAMVYKHWFEPLGGLPRQWQEVGQWEIPGMTGGRDVTVSFYAVDPEEADALAAHLREFSSELPSQVAQRGLYLDPHRPATHLATRADRDATRPR